MKSAAVRHALVTALLLAATGCGNDATSAAPAPASPASPAPSDTGSAIAGLPPMPERYRKTLTRAFATASEGRSPTMACTSVIAKSAGNPLPDGVVPDPDSIRAFELCYIDVGARYIAALLAQIAADGGAKDELCAKIASYAVIARTSLGSFAGNVHLDVATLDKRLLERVLVDMTATCPDQIEALSGYR